MNAIARDERRARREWAKRELDVSLRIVVQAWAALQRGDFRRAGHLFHESEWLPKGWPMGEWPGNNRP
jgi:hypothetical protein